MRARLKNNHHTRISSAPATPPSMAYIDPSIETNGAMTATTTCTTAIATPGQRRRGFILYSTAALDRAAAMPTIPRNVFFTRNRTIQNTIMITGIRTGMGNSDGT